MTFAAGVATKVALWLLAFIILDCQNLYCGASKKCIKEECGGYDERRRAEAKGEALCSGEKGSGPPGTPCWFKCEGGKPAEDQHQCWKDRCQSDGRGFCEKPGMKSIKPEQCEEYLNEGKAKFYGRGCSDYLP